MKCMISSNKEEMYGMNGEKIIEKIKNRMRAKVKGITNKFAIKLRIEKL